MIGWLNDREGERMNGWKIERKIERFASSGNRGVCLYKYCLDGCQPDRMNGCSILMT